MRRLILRPVTFGEASAFVAAHHRHHLPPVGWKWGHGVAEVCPRHQVTRVCGVLTVGRPVARALDDGWTVEVTRCCTDGTPHAASLLYGAAWRAARALGYRRLVTYTLASERGTSLRAAGWTALYETRGGTWDTPSRPRLDRHPTGPKTLWEAGPSRSQAPGVAA